MTSTEYIKQGVKPVVGGVIWSPHSMIFERGYPYTHKILNVKRKDRDGELQYLVTVETKTPLKKVAYKKRTLWLDEID